MHHAIARELSMLKPGDHAEHALLFRERKVRLEANEIIALLISTLCTQLHHRPGAFLCARIHESDWLQRSKPWCIESFACDLFDRLASLEQIARFEFLLDNATRIDELLCEGFIFFFVERRIEIVPYAFFVAALAEHDIIVERIRIDDRRRSVIEGKMVFPGERTQRFCERRRSKRARSDDAERCRVLKNIWPLMVRIFDDERARRIDAHHLGFDTCDPRLHERIGDQ